MINKPKIAVLQFPGSNTELETVAAIKRNNMEPVSHLWNESLSSFHTYSGYIIVGGFSYEDRSRAGIIASLDPIMNELKKQAVLGKPILGICNGAQILVESGMVPGNKGFDTLVGLSENKRVQNKKVVGSGYYNAWCYIKKNKNSRSAFIDHKKNDVLRVPVAHAEGRFLAEKSFENIIHHENLAVYQYCDKQGSLINDFPTNPNGSMNNIAALGNKPGNVMAIMPHPERTTNGDSIFSSLNDFISSDQTFSYKSLSFEAKKVGLLSYQKKKQSSELLISMIIADNEAISVQNCIKKISKKSITIKKYLHLEIEHDGKLDFDALFKTDVLYNPSKEFVATNITQGSGNRFIVRNKEDVSGRKMKETLQKRFGFDNISKVSKGTVWEIVLDKKQTKKDIDLILNSHILCNPISQECHEY
mgnify:CR=1 FL=1|tara:strand:+ start:5169 stop:6422 length:1254 start_codon:yes stop_codon:yes gene_type:complete